LGARVSTIEAVEGVIVRLLEQLPDGAAALSVENDISPRGKSLILTPSNPSAASIHVDVSDDSDVVTLTIGRGAVFEVPLEGHRYSRLPYLDEIRAICLAAIHGEIEETVWFKGRDIIGGTGSAKIGSTKVGDSWRKLFTNPLRRATKRSFVYEPYA
jgi:hypothetical protein